MSASRPVGRPSLLTPKARRALLDAIRAGASLEIACIAAGISESTLRNWRARGQAEPDGPYGSLLGELDRAEAEAEVRFLHSIAVSTGGARWILARRHPERWSERRNERVLNDLMQRVLSIVRARVDDDTYTQILFDMAALNTANEPESWE